MERVQEAVTVCLRRIGDEFLQKNPEPSLDSTARLKVLIRLGTDWKMDPVWREILKRKPRDSSGVQAFVHLIVDERFQINDPRHKHQIKNEDEQRIAVAINIATVAAWLVLEPPEQFSVEEHQKRIEKIKHLQNNAEDALQLSKMSDSAVPASPVVVDDVALEPIPAQVLIEGIVDLRRKQMRMLSLPIYQAASHERKKGNWEHRVKIAAMSTIMKQMFGGRFEGLTARILSVALDTKISEASVKRFMKIDGKHS